MRSDRIATWTSGEPVSFGLVAYSWIRAVLRSAVIDIGHIPFEGGLWSPQPGCRPGGAVKAQALGPKAGLHIVQTGRQYQNLLILPQSSPGSASRPSGEAAAKA